VDILKQGMRLNSDTSYLRDLNKVLKYVKRFLLRLSADWEAASDRTESSIWFISPDSLRSGRRCRCELTDAMTSEPLRPGVRAGSEAFKSPPAVRALLRRGIPEDPVCSTGVCWYGLGC
jgi:hypothetical protein